MSVESVAIWICLINNFRFDFTHICPRIALRRARMLLELISWLCLCVCVCDWVCSSVCYHR